MAALPGDGTQAIRVVRKAVSGISIGTVLRTLLPEAITEYAQHGWAKPGVVDVIIGENECGTVGEADNYGSAGDDDTGELGDLCRAIEMWAPGVVLLIHEMVLEGGSGGYLYASRIRATQAACAAAGERRILVPRDGITTQNPTNPHYDLAGYALAGDVAGDLVTALVRE